MSKKTIAIIDFGTPECVRSTMGYDCYILYAHLKNDPTLEVTLFEDATPFKIFRAKRYDEYIIHVWNYHQLASAEYVRTQFPGIKYFIGYKPFDEIMKIPFYPGWNDEVIKSGVKHLPEILDEMKYGGLMCDCDMHIKSDDTRPVYPLFLSYGCPCSCSFCPVPACRAYSDEKRLAIAVDEAIEMVRTVVMTNKNIHFFDEDFFIDRNFVNAIIPKFIELQNEMISLGMKPFKWIALTTVPTLARAIKDLTEDVLLEAGLFLAELGLESNDPNIRKMMKKTGSNDQIGYILENSKNINKLWLAITFFAGETVTSLNHMGDFLKIYGLNPDQTGDRLLTNGNICGLGQFFQRYHGTTSYDMTLHDGLLLQPELPMRLTPSFIPQSFLDCKPIFEKYSFDSWYDKFIVACRIYNIELSKYRDIMPLMNGRYTIDYLKEEVEGDIGDFMIFMALLARFSYIKEYKNELFV
jgi:hypothetical protein